MPTNNPKRILLLFSDTGGGHRSAAEAIREALHAKCHGEVVTEMVDLFKDYTPYPFNRMPAWYPIMIRRGSRAWGAGFAISNGARRSRLMSTMAYPWVRPACRRLAREHPADLVINVHPLFIGPVLRALGKDRPPFINVVTDLVSAHAWWYHPRVDFCFVPTEPARQLGLRYGLPEEKIRVAGLPVAARFCTPPGDKRALRTKLGWGVDGPIVLVVGGGEGMGPLYEITSRIHATGARCQVVVVAGRNEKLRQRLLATPWRSPVHVYGFTREMPDFMRAADILVTKAGPGTISEALNAGLPMILSGRIPGQEDGNVRYVVAEGAGVWAPGPERVAEAVDHWLSNPGWMARAAAHARRLARPNAAREIAESAWGWLAGEEAMKSAAGKPA